jgi:AraC family ethanolamine operon transcriptional activator
VTEDRAQPSEDVRGNPPVLGVWRSRDPSLHEQAVKPWELLTELPSGEPFLHEMRYLSTPSFAAYEERFSCSVRLRGQSPPGFIVLAVPMRLSPTTTCWKDPWSAEQIPALAQGALDVFLGQGHKQLVVFIAPSLARRELGEERTEALERACRARWLPTTGRQVRRLRDFLLRLIETVATSPLLLHRPETLRSIEADLIRNVAAAICLPAPNPARGRANAARIGRGRLVARVLEHVRATDPVNLSIPQLCRAAGVEQRSLEYAFRETFDLTPLGFLKLRHLHSARHRLILADPRDMAVSDIAYREGFYHLGRFAAAYRSIFGEYPSETLQRPCPREFKTVMAVSPLWPTGRTSQANKKNDGLSGIRTRRSGSWSTLRVRQTAPFAFLSGAFCQGLR